jgi:hypothetical protein
VGQLLDQQHALQTRLDGLQALNAALKPLAEAFSEDQRASLDALFLQVSGMMGMMPMQGMMSAADMPAMTDTATPSP